MLPSDSAGQVFDRERTRGRAIGRRICVVVAVVVAVAGGLWSMRDNREEASALAGLERYLPARLEREFGYVGSESCRSCHAHEYSTWHASYHRTMTQPATAEAVVGDFDNVTLGSDGWTCRMTRRGGEFWVEMVDPDWFAELAKKQKVVPADYPNPPRVEKRVVMTTGSHHKQTYWVPSSAGRFLQRVPWTYRMDDQRWVPTLNDFLAPPDAALGAVSWNVMCIQCHATGGQPRQFGPSTYDTRAAELGVACEACHGPAAEHVKAHKDPAYRDRLEQGGGPDPTIVNPLYCTPKQATHICAQCHSFFLPKNYQTYLAVGHRFRPGDDLHESRRIPRLADSSSEEWLEEHVKRHPQSLASRFWEDGTARVTGRNYNGLLESACYQRGEMSCLSCHSMHNYVDRDDQLTAPLNRNDSCVGCHSGIADDLEGHTFHPADSSGSLCINCHMPRTTYGLFKAVHSHRIDSPSVATSVQFGRPNACNLCHLDKTLAWTGERLSLWYGQPDTQLDPDEQQVAASLLWILRGDAVKRVIAAWHMGWEPARRVSGEDWIAPFLALLLDDPYSAVRNVARRSLQRLPGFTNFDYDFLAPVEQQKASVTRALDIWKKESSRFSGVENNVLIEPASKSLMQDRIDGIRRQRDDRPLYIAE